MPPFPRPAFSYNYRLQTQLAALRRYRETEPGRAVPEKAPDRLLVATWNVANLGLQERSEPDYRLIAEIITWFDLVALQEVNDNLAGLREIRRQLPSDFRVLFSDAAGNDERLTFVYDSEKVRLGEEVGEVAVPPSELPRIRLPDSMQGFEGFDRNPYLALFEAGSFIFELVNVHLYFGSESPTSLARRRLETLAVARWADLRRRSPYASTADIIPLGDFNLPKAERGDPIYDQLTSRGLHVPTHSTQIGSSIASESHYDQVVFFPGETEAQFSGRIGVFDFDGALFHELWKSRPLKDFLAYVRYHISDHRPLWAEFVI